MSQLPPDPLAHIDDAQLSQESIQAIANFAIYVLVPKQFGIISGVKICGKVLLFHVALRLSRENGIQQAYRYLSSITGEETGERPFNCVFTYLAKLAAITGHENFGQRFNVLCLETEANFLRGDVNFEPSPERQENHNIPPQTSAPPVPPQPSPQPVPPQRAPDAQASPYAYLEGLNLPPRRRQ